MIDRIVIDTNVLVSALRSKRGTSYRLLTSIGSKRFETVISVPLVLESEDVLLREYMPLDANAITDILDYICLVSSKRKLHYLWRPVLKDPKDDHILELAIEAQCSTIITFNKRDFEGSAQFGIAIETPFEFLERLGLL